MTTAKQWDAIVIGSGLGGLTCAAYLATNNRRVLVLEQNQVAGGCTQVFRRRTKAGKWEFDVGVHYFGQCHDGGDMNLALRGLALEKRIDWEELDPDGYATLVFPDFTIRVPKSWDAYIERMLAQFPKEKTRLRLVLNILRRIATELRTNGVPRNLLKAPLTSPTVLAGSLVSIDQLFSAFRISKQARSAIVAEAGDYLVRPSRTSTAMHAGFMDHYLAGGAFYPAGGGQVIPAHLIDVIQTHGGAVHTNVTVEKIIVTDGRVEGVQLATGEELRSDVVVSNADVIRTYRDLVGLDQISAKTAAKLKKWRMAAPLFTVYLGLDIDVNERLNKSVYWLHTSYEPEKLYQDNDRGIVPDDLTVFVSSATTKDPGNKHAAPPGHSTIELCAMVPPDHSFWSVSGDPGVGDEYSHESGYLARKEQLTERIIDGATRLIPDLRDHIVFVESSTPITQERFASGTGGTSYGLELSMDQIGPFRPGVRTEIRGLFLAGASTTYNHGIAGTIVGGMHTAAAILRRNLSAEIKAGQIYTDVSKLTAGGEDWDPLLASKPRAEGRRKKARADA